MSSEDLTGTGSRAERGELSARSYKALGLKKLLEQNRFILTHLGDFYALTHDVDGIRSKYPNAPTAGEFTKIRDWAVTQQTKIERAALGLSKGNRRGEFTGFNAAKLYNQDMYDFVNNANLGPIVDGDVSVTVGADSGKKIWKFKNLRSGGGRLQDDIMALQAGLTYAGQNVILSQKNTLGHLLAVNCYYTMYAGAPAEWKGSEIDLSDEINTYLSSYFADAGVNLNTPVKFNDLSNLAHRTAIPDVKIGESKDTKTKQNVSVTPSDIMNQIQAFFNEVVAGDTRNYFSYLKETLDADLQGTSPTLQADLTFENQYTLIPLYDALVAKKAYQLTQVDVTNAKPKAVKKPARR